MNTPHTITFNGNTWIDMQDPTAEEINAVAKQYNLNEHLVRDAMEADHLPKFDAIDDIQFLLLRYYAPEDNRLNSSIQELTNKITIFYTGNYLITIHKDGCKLLQTLQEKVSSGKAILSVEALIIKIAWLVLESFDVPVQNLSADVEKHEQSVLLRSHAADLTGKLYAIKRQASAGYKVITLMQEPINHIPATGNNKPAYRDLRDQHLKMLTLYHQCLEDVTNLLNVAMAMSSQKTNEVVKVLTLFSVFFMPLTFIVGIYGMNFRFMHELDWKYGYPTALGLMLLVSAIIYAWFKKKKWL